MRNSSTAKRGVGITKKDCVYVGLDVHKRSVYATVRINGEEHGSKSLPADAEIVKNFLEKYRLGLRKVVYEAGPTGYGLARRLRENGIPAEVVAPGKIPRSAVEGSKSDRLDCRMLAEYAEKGLLKSVVIPTIEEEAFRQVLRLRSSLVEKRRRVKQQTKSFLLQYGLEEPEGLNHWSRKAVKALGEMELHSALRFTLDHLLEELFHLEEQLKKVGGQIKEQYSSKAYEKKAKILKSHPGVGEVTAAQMLAEVYQPERFENARQVAAYVGLAPRVRQSGESRKEGPLMKAGKGQLRASLVESAWSWIRVDRQAAKLYGRLVRNTGSPNKAIVAMARKILVHLWTMLVRQEAYRPMA
jgi:transposase